MRIISVTGGKGGIGKTTISVNMALSFAKLKKKVLLFDADLGLANVDVVLGLRPEKTMNDFLSGECSLTEICMKGPYGINIIPSASGIQQMAELSSSASAELIRSFSTLTDEIDVMIIDLASGISSQVMNFTHASQDIIIVICNDPSSLMDSYAVIKILHKQYARSRFGIIVNKVSNPQEGLNVFSRFQQTTAQFLSLSMHYLGAIPNDDYIGMAAREHVAVVEKFPQAKSVKAFQDICQGIMHWNDNATLPGGIQFFFERLIQTG